MPSTRQPLHLLNPASARNLAFMPKHAPASAPERKTAKSSSQNKSTAHTSTNVRVVLPIRALVSRYEMRNSLGKGNMGVVYRALDRTNNTEVAVKIVPKHKLRRTDEIKCILREIELLKLLKHKHILTFRDAFQDKNAIYIVTEYCQKGDLFSYLSSRGEPLKEREALKYMRQLFQAMQHLQRHGVSHRDIKPENILLTNDGNIMLADFGLCFWQPPTGSPYAKKHCGTPQYCAPEVLSSTDMYLPGRSDMWSSGVLLYAMVTRRLPFSAKDTLSFSRVIANADIDKIVSGLSPFGISRPCRHLIRSLLSKDPARRPTPRQAVTLVENALIGPSPFAKRS